MDVKLDSGEVEAEVPEEYLEKQPVEGPIRKRKAAAVKKAQRKRRKA